MKKGLIPLEKDTLNDIHVELIHANKTFALYSTKNMGE